MLASFSKYLRPGVYAMGHVAWVLLAMFVVTSIVLAFLIFVLGTAFGLDESALTSPVGLLILFALQFIIALGFTSLLPLGQANWKFSKLKELFGVTRGLKAKDFYLPLLVLPLYFVASAIVLSIATVVLPFVDFEQVQDVGFNADNLKGVLSYVLAFIALVILAPLAEELLFRGYLFGKVRVLVGAIAAGIITSITFGLAHGQWNVGIDTFVLSLFLCGLRQYTGAIWASMILHGLKNLLAYTLLFLLPLFGIDLLQLLT